MFQLYFCLVLIVILLNKHLISADSPDSVTNFELEMSMYHNNTIFQDNITDYARYYEKFNYLLNISYRSILVHEHIPKAGGTALSLALSSECTCRDKGERSPGDCRNCKRIIGNNGDSFRYSYSRLSGWPCGLGHPPLAWLYNLPCDKPYTFRDIGLYPVYIVMLRDPFDRFYAETLHWCTPGSCMDWRTNVDIEKCLLRRRNRHSSRYKVEFDDSCLLEANANVSDRLMIHNRMVKMIGGLVEYFDLNVNGHTVGKEASRWSVKNESNEFMTEIQNRAIELVKRDFNIIILIQEYFEQSLCVLEILYGHLYRFKWDPHSHSHNGEEQKDGQLYGRHDIMKESDAYRKSEAYLIFERKNSYDCQFYNASVDSFHRQFRVVLEFFRRNTTQSSHMKNVPHCIPYL